ncbi:MAG: HEAT repeat domain-containing protein [Bacteroidia bacterium]
MLENIQYQVHRLLSGDADAGLLLIFGAISGFLLLAAMFLLITLLSRIAKTADERKQHTLKQIFEDFIMNALYGDKQVQEISLPMVINPFKRKYLRTRFQQQLMTTELVNLGKGLDGEIMQNLIELFYRLDLNMMCLQKLRSKNWHIVAEGIAELREMRVHEALPKIITLINHPEKSVRNEVQLAVLEMGESANRMDAFLEINYNLTQWEQIRLHESLKSRGRRSIVSFSNLYNAHNPDVCRFGMRMSAYFGMTNDIPALQQYVHHKVEALRIESIHALTHLGDFQIQEALAQQFSHETEAVRKEILHYLTGSGFESLQLFLDALTGESREISLAAARSLLHSYPSKFIQELIDGLQLNEAIRARIAHVSDSRLT